MISNWNFPIFQIITALGVLAAIFVIGKNFLENWGSVKKSVKNIEDMLDKEIRPDLKNVRERFIGMEAKVDVLWKDKFAPSSSPRQLNERGQDVLNKSGIARIIDAHKDAITQDIRLKRPESPYDAEKLIIEFMTNEFLGKYPLVASQIKEGAFLSGVDVNTVLFVGSIYLRNLIFSDLGFNLTDLDKQHTTKK